MCLLSKIIAVTGYLVLMFLNNHASGSTNSANILNTNCKEVADKSGEAECGNHFRIKYQFHQNEKNNLSDEQEKGRHSMYLFFQDNSEISFSVTHNEKISQECSLEDLDKGNRGLEGSFCNRKIIRTSLCLQLSDGNGTQRSILNIKKLPSATKLRGDSVVISLSDGTEESILAIVKPNQHLSYPESTDTMGTSKIAVDVELPPVLGMRWNAAHREGTGERESYLDWNFNIDVNSEQTISLHFDTGDSSDFPVNRTAENLFGDERKSKLVANIMAAIHLKKENVTIKKRLRESKYTMYSDYLTYDAISFLNEFENGDVIEWIFVESESYLWPKLKHSLSQMITHNPFSENGWEACLVKFPWGHISVKANFKKELMINKTVSVHFYTVGPFTKADMDFTFRPFSFSIRLDCLELEWNLILESTLTGFLMIITRNDFWTQFKNSITMLKVIVEDEILQGNPDGKMTIKLGNLLNFKKLFRNYFDPLAKNVEELSSILLEGNIVSSYLEFLVENAGVTSEKYIAKIKHAESVMLKMARIIVHHFEVIAIKKNIHIQDVLLKSLKRIGGNYIESDDNIHLKFRQKNLSNLPKVIVEESLNQLCSGVGESRKVSKFVNEIIPQFSKFVLESVSAFNIFSYT